MPGSVPIPTPAQRDELRHRRAILFRRAVDQSTAKRTTIARRAGISRSYLYKLLNEECEGTHEQHCRVLRACGLANPQQAIMDVEAGREEMACTAIQDFCGRIATGLPEALTEAGVGPHTVDPNWAGTAIKMIVERVMKTAELQNS